ncbi:J domain-containing protein [Psidium guajava]|nr:J domain-containing protein [Psidium guajava]
MKFQASFHIEELIFYFLAPRDITSATEKYRFPASLGSKGGFTI